MNDIFRQDNIPEQNYKTPIATADVIISVIQEVLGNKIVSQLPEKLEWITPQLREKILSRLKFIEYHSNMKPYNWENGFLFSTDFSIVRTFKDFQKGNLNKEVNDMPDNDSIMKYIEFLDKDRRDMELRLSEDKKEMEKRLTDDRRESEERYNKTVERIEAKMEKISADNTSFIKEHRFWVVTTIIAIVGLCVLAYFATGQLVASIVH